MIMICLELLFMESLMCDYNNNSYIYDKNWSGNFWGENSATRQVCRMCTPDLRLGPQFEL